MAFCTLWNSGEIEKNEGAIAAFSKSNEKPH
jgi:hypothetical protein